MLCSVTLTKQLLPSSSQFWIPATTMSPPHEFQDSQNLVSALKLSCYQIPTLDNTYSLSLISCSSPILPSCFPYSCIHFLAVFSFTLLLPLTLTLSALLILLINAMFLDLVYKTLLHVIIHHVQILTLILISLSTRPCSEPLNP